MARYIDADALLKQLAEVAQRANENAAYTGDRSSALTWDMAVKYVKNAPTANVIELDAATICGYPARETSIFVQVLQKYNVTPGEVKEFVTTLENALKVVQDSYKATYDEATKMWTGTYEVPANMAGLYKMMREQGK